MTQNEQAPMKRTTRKLSGPAKDRFLERFIAAEPGLDAALAGRLTARCQSAFTSLRIRRSIKLTARCNPASAPAQSSASAPTIPQPTPAEPPALQTAFDPYVFGLVPVFQREGRDGLLARLKQIARIDELRLMAKTQQIVLPPEQRSGETDIVRLATAIADAVAKRIADRRAAAG